MAVLCARGLVLHAHTPLRAVSSVVFAHLAATMEPYRTCGQTKPRSAKSRAV
jgi:phage terminase large subunit-like protein